MSTVTITVHDAEALDGRLTVRRVEAQPASGPYKPAMPEHYAIELDRHYVLRIDADALAPLLAAAWDEGGSAAQDQRDDLPSGRIAAPSEASMSATPTELNISVPRFLCLEWRREADPHLPRATSLRGEGKGLRSGAGNL